MKLIVEAETIEQINIMLMEIPQDVEMGTYEVDYGDGMSWHLERED